MQTAHENQASKLDTAAYDATAGMKTEATTEQSPESHQRSKHNEVQLTDQTNLGLPFRTILTSFLCLSLCILVSQLDSVIVATALPTISSAFNAGSVSSWVPSAYLLTSTSFSPLYGRFSDIFGRKATLTVAMLIFMVGNLAAGFSKSVVELIVLRGVAGAGGGALLSMAQIIVSDIVSLRERGKYQGILGGVVTLGYAIGPIAGGALAEKASWRWCFWICLPISVLAIVGVNFVLPLISVGGDIKRKLKVVDYVGSLLTLVACTLIILPLIWGGVTFPWNSAVVIAPLLCGALAFILFTSWEWKGARLPIVPMRIFRHSTVCGVYIVMFINGLITYSLMFYLPQFFQVALAYSPIHAGLFLIPVLGGQVVVSWCAGVAVSRTGRYRTIVHSGFAIWSLACGLISTMTPHTKQGVMIVYMLLSAVGSGQTLQTTTVAAQASVPRKDMSVVTAFRNFVRMLGGTLGLAIGATLINNTLRSSMMSLSLSEKLIKTIIDDPTRLSNPSQLNLSVEQATTILENGYTKGFRSVFLLNASLSAFATVVSIVMIKHKNLNRDDHLKNRPKNDRKEHDEEKGGDDEKHDVGRHDSPIESTETTKHDNSDGALSVAEVPVSEKFYPCDPTVPASSSNPGDSETRT